MIATLRLLRFARNDISWKGTPKSLRGVERRSNLDSKRKRSITWQGFLMTTHYQSEIHL
jgi:hypothetical protein